jgi:hypothetical protein
MFSTNEWNPEFHRQQQPQRGKHRQEDADIILKIT